MPLNRDDLEPTTLLADGLDDAFIGVTYRDSVQLAVYSALKVIEVLMRDNDWDDLEAVEWYEFNISGAYMGVGTPVFVDDINYD